LQQQLNAFNILIFYRQMQGSTMSCHLIDIDFVMIQQNFSYTVSMMLNGQLEWCVLIDCLSIRRGSFDQQEGHHFKVIHVDRPM